MTLWAARTGVGARSRGVGRSCGPRTTSCCPYDCAATAVHASGCTRPGILTDGELADVETRLADDRRGGRRVPRRDEDVHSAIEGLLGPVGRKIHAGRSRNDQVAAALRLYVERRVRRGAARRSTRSTATILDVAEREAETPMPGYTHLQRAQPVTFGHHLLAWVEMLERDRDAVRARGGAGGAERRSAPARSPARRCRCRRPPTPMRNSLDAVADRDFALDYLYACAVLFTHLSRIGEELVLWCTTEFGFVRLPESAATARR